MLRARFFGTDDMMTIRNSLMQLQARSTPDELQLPSLACALVRTGDLVYLPAGFILVEKAVNDDCISFRTACATVLLVVVLTLVTSWNGL